MEPQRAEQSGSVARTAKVPAPVPDISDLRQRMAALQPGDACKGMFFNSVLRAAQELCGPDGLAQVQRGLPERKYIDFFNYGSQHFLPAAFLTAQLMTKTTGSFGASMIQLGERAIRDFLATPVGATLLSVSAGNLKRLFQASPVAYKTAVTYGTRETLCHGETACTFRVKRDLMPPEYHQGVYLEVLRSTKSKVVEVTFERTGPLDADYHIRWA